MQSKPKFLSTKSNLAQNIFMGGPSMGISVPKKIQLFPMMFQSNEYAWPHDKTFLLFT